MQYHPSLRVFQIKQSQKGWIFIGDNPKDFAILQSESKMEQVLRPNIKVSLPKSYHSADVSKVKVLVFKEVSGNITLDDLKELLAFNKINHAETEHMKSKDQVDTFLLLTLNVITQKKPRHFFQGDSYARKQA